MAKVKTVEKVIELMSIPANGAKKTMWRGGRMFEVKKPQVLELTDEEVKVYEDDARFKVSDPTDSGEQEQGDEASDSEGDAQGSDSDSSSDDSSEGEDSEDQGSDDSEADSGSDPEDEADEDASDPEDLVKALVQDNDRNELNAKAVEVGLVEKAEEADTKYKSKTEVAQAIVEAQASNSDGGATS